VMLGLHSFAVAESIRIISGMRPTGRFHIGNYLGAAKNWVELQDRYECFYFVADYHALTTEPDGHKAEDKVFDLTADLLAVGIDPDRSVVYLQSKVPEVAELTLLLSMVTPLSWVQRVPTFKEKAKLHPDNVNLSMVTDVKRPRRTDPGHPRQCNVCAFYKYFFDDWEHYWELCRKAQIGCYDKKRLLAERIIETFAPFRERRSELSPEAVNSILDVGSLKARDVARATLREARRAVGLPAYLDR